MRTFLRFVSAGLLAPALLHVSVRADARIDTHPSATLGSPVVVSGPGNTFVVPTVLDLNEDTLFDDLFIGEIGTGSLTLSSQATGNAGTVYVGLNEGSSGSLTVSSGASLTAAGLNLGYNFGSSGTALITGSGTTVTAPSLNFYGGDAQLAVTDHATLTSASGSFISNGSITVSSGATLTTGGTNDEYFDLFSVGADENTPATVSMLVTGAGTTWQSAGTISVGREYVDDDASLTLADHATLTHNGTLVIGSGTSFTVSGGADVALTTSGSYSGIFRVDGATALITGTGTTLNAAASLAIATSADATLTIADGATVSTALFTAYGGGGEYAGDGRATINVTGAGSALNVTGATNNDFTSLFALNINQGASVTTNQRLKLDGTTTLASGGTLTSTYTGINLHDINGDLTVTGAGSRFSTATNTAFANGTLMVTNGGNFTASTNLQIANGSSSSAVVSAGGTIDSLGAVIGYAQTANSTSVHRTGYATITGAGSTWRNTEIFTVGHLRDAELTVANGGRLIVGDYTSGNTAVGELRLGGSGTPTARINATTLVTGAGSLVQARTTHVGWGLYATSALTVTDHATFATDALTIYNGDTVTVGDFATLSAGALTAQTGSTLALQSHAILGFTLGDTAAHASWNFAAGSTLTVASDAPVYFDFTPGAGFETGTYTLFSFDPTATVTGLNSTNLFTHDGPAGYAFDYALVGNALSVTVSATAIPEPATTAALLAGAATGLVVWQRRRSRRLRVERAF